MPIITTFSTVEFLFCLQSVIFLKTNMLCKIERENFNKNIQQKKKKQTNKHRKHEEKIITIFFICGKNENILLFFFLSSLYLLVFIYHTSYTYNLHMYGSVVE